MAEQQPSHPAELDKLIQSFEYENQQYVKQIERENQQIEALDREISEKKLAITQLRETVTQLDEDTKRCHKQFIQNRDNCESLKKTTVVLKEHEEALHKKLAALIENGNQECAERQGILQHYSDIREDYEEKYKSFPLAKALEEKQNQVEELENQLREMEDKLRVAQQQLNSLSVNNDPEIKDFKKFVIRLAELKVNTEKMTQEISMVTEEKNGIEAKIEEIKQVKAQAEKTQEVVQMEEEEAKCPDSESEPPSVKESQAELNLSSSNPEPQDMDDDSVMISVHSNTEDHEEQNILSSGISTTSKDKELNKGSGDFSRDTKQLLSPDTHASYSNMSETRPSQDVQQGLRTSKVLHHQFPTVPRTTASCSPEPMSFHISEPPCAGQNYLLSVPQLRQPVRQNFPINGPESLSSGRSSSVKIQTSPNTKVKMPQNSAVRGISNIVRIPCSTSSEVQNKQNVSTRPTGQNSSVPVQRPTSIAVPLLASPSLPAGTNSPCQSNVNRGPQPYTRPSIVHPPQSVGRPAAIRMPQSPMLPQQQVHTQVNGTSHTSSASVSRPRVPVIQQLTSQFQTAKLHRAAVQSPVVPTRPSMGDKDSSPLANAGSPSQVRQSPSTPGRPSPPQAPVQGRNMSPSSEAPTGGAENQSVEDMQVDLPTKSPVHHRICNADAAASPFDMEKHKKRLKELTRSPGTPPTMFASSRLMFESSMTRDEDKDSSSAFLQPFFNQSSKQNSGGFLSRFSDDNNTGSGGIEMNLFGGGSNNLFTDSTESGAKSSSSMEFSFGGSTAFSFGGESNSTNSSALTSLFGTGGGGGDPDQGQTTKETSFSFSFGGSESNSESTSGFTLF